LNLLAGLTWHSHAAGSGGSVILSWPASIYGYHLQSTSNLLGDVWADLAVTVTQTHGFNLATVQPLVTRSFFGSSCLIN